MSAILLLNASYEPLAVIPARRALSLLLRERVDAVTEELINISTTAHDLSIPTVLRLRRYVRAPKRGVRWSRRGIFQRDNYGCIYCGIRAGEAQGELLLTKRDFTLDHILPKSRGGRNTWSNTACACPKCNQRKGNRTPHEAGMALLWEPKTPRVDYWVASGEVPTAWKFYLESSG
ncbi:MAG: HNH endonuclease [Caldilineaceae bacterium]|nr:HNH endonuclease [Caldilineaceae bacterium]